MAGKGQGMIAKRFDEATACGMLLGLAVGDALGAGADGVARQDLEPVTGMRGGGRHDLAPGQWGAATAMAMCLAQMLRSANGWDAEDAMRRYLNWRDHGYLSSTRRCFGMDAASDAALRGYEATGNPYSGQAAPEGEGGGGIMRLAPVVLAYGAEVPPAQAVAQLQSRMTHAAPKALQAAANLAQVMVSGDFAPLPRPEAPPEVVTDEVTSLLHAAFWALGQAEDFEGQVLAAVNLGGEAARAGAITGQLAGRLHGLSGIPAAWRAALYDYDKIRVAAEDLHAMRPIDM